MNFLISNDDGVHAPGLLVLYHALSTIGEVTAVAVGYISLSPVRLHHTPTTTLDKLSALIL
ncbi:5'/3'-nucleotidase SurE [Psychrobacter sp. LV10R520-6]|uniref:5'/3'-nucleotidase SurE n=1 Tax=Psychrobacter sp. LV10R520-6 TaxID=1415574 RepID=UPI0024C782B2|nr:Survival protein SurE [Psychrobacter sp. LV10R520-6]